MSDRKAYIDVSKIADEIMEILEQKTQDDFKVRELVIKELDHRLSIERLLD